MDATDKSLFDHPSHLEFSFPQSTMSNSYHVARSTDSLRTNDTVSSKSNIVAITDPSQRAHLLSEYIALEPSLALRSEAIREKNVAENAQRYADRIHQARNLDISETPSERQLFDDILVKLSRRASAPAPSSARKESLEQKRRYILAVLYPSNHWKLTPLTSVLIRERRSVSLLRHTLRDQALAMRKLTDAANLLLLIADHIEILAACYRNGCISPPSSFSPSSSANSSDCSSEDDNAPRVGCLGRASSDSSPTIFVSSVPSSYRFRYLRKCWGYAAKALAEAVDASTFLMAEVERLGQRELIPGLEGQCKRYMWLLELPGGLTVFFRTDYLHKLCADARHMRQIVFEWQAKVKRFSAKTRADMSRTRAKVHALKEKVRENREQLLAEEFRDVFSSVSAPLKDDDARRTYEYGR